MKILVISDSHGAKSAVINAVKKETPDYILHLGDGINDCTALASMFPDIPIRTVKGNCDVFSTSSETEGFTLEGKQFLMTHGHIFYVKSTLAKLIKYAKELRADVVLYGHTHTPHNEQIKKMLIVNPGSIGYSVPKKYAVIEIHNGEISCEHRNL